MSLYDHRSQYLEAGTHDVSVTNLREFQCNTGSRGVELSVADASGASSKASFVLTTKSLWRIAGFCAACGITKQQLESINDAQALVPATYRMLIGKRVTVRVELQKDSDKYHEVASWKPVSSSPQAQHSAASPETNMSPAPVDYGPPPYDDEAPELPTGDEIPF